MNTHEINKWLDLLQNGLDYDQSIELFVLTGSMMPFMVPGKKIEIRKANIRQISIGDIIIFKDNKSLTGHRVLLKFPLFRPTFFYQKGDKNQFGGWIKSNRIIGVVSQIQPNTEESIDLTANHERWKSKRIAYKQIINLLINYAFYYPRKIKHCFF